MLQVPLITNNQTLSLKDILKPLSTSSLSRVSVSDEKNYEESCLREGGIQWVERYAKRVSKQQEGMTDYGKKLVNRAIEPMADAVKGFLAEADNGPGRRHTAAQYLSLLAPNVVAFVAARVIIDRISNRQNYLSTATEIGRRIEDEVRFGQFDQDKPALFDRTMEQLKDHPLGFQKNIRRRVLVHAMNKFGVAWAKWDEHTHAHIGFKLIELFIMSTGMVQIVKDLVNENRSVYLEAAPELTELLVTYKARAEFLHPHFQPMLRPPAPWSNLRDGGYYHPRLKYRLVKVMARARGQVVELELANMPEVYAAVNRLQETPWRVNQRMLEIVDQVWESGLIVKGLPPKYEIPKPPEPEYDPNDESKKRAWVEWKEEAADTYRKNRSYDTKRIQTIRILSLARKFKDMPAVWFPFRLDFRGRMYPMAPHLNPQGSDLAKSLLQFGEGKPVDERGEFWLAMHVANVFGFDKVNLDERVSWTRKNSWWIEQVADDPLHNRQWLDADKPFQFLAAAIEWNAYLQAKYSGDQYVSHLAVMVDGSCNGLQHYSAMLRDEVAGKFVNLVPSENPADIYAEVAAWVKVRLDVESQPDLANSEVARQWLTFGIDRKLAKRPVMVLPYGGTLEAVRKYIEQRVLEVVEETKQPHPFGRRADFRKAVNYLATIMWDVMQDVISGPMKAMAWLRKAAQQAAYQGLPLTWTTPTGFIVVQAYPNLRRRRVKTKAGDEAMMFTLIESTEKLDSRKQGQAVAPNFVHSLDASALAMTVNAAFRKGVTSFAAIHDSYGTHAADMDRLQLCLREVFVRMYTSEDVLTKFADQLLAMEKMAGKQLDPLPERGNLDLTGILRSDFFFA